MANSSENKIVKRCLLIANENYQRGQRLKYPLNNINDLRNKLIKYSFQVTLGTNLLSDDFDFIIENFIQQINENDLVLFIYSGYGIHFNHDNYLVPIDNRIIDNEKLFAFYCVHLQTVIENISRRHPSSSIFLFDSSFPYIIIDEATLKTSDDYGGFSQMKLFENSLMMFSCEPLKTVKEKSINNRNTIFISCLLQYIDQVNLPVDQLVDVIYDEIIHQTDHQIIPFKISSLPKNILLNQQIHSDLSQRRSLIIEDIISECKIGSFVDLRNKQLIDRDMKVIVEQLLIKKQTTRLWLNENQFTPLGASILALALNSNVHLERLYLAANSISDIGLKYLSEALSTRNKTLKVLDLQQNQITDSGIEHFSLVIKKNQSLTSLSLDSNLFTDKSIKILTNAFLNSNSSIEYLGLSDNQSLTDSAFEHLANLIQSTKSINEISLHHCQFTKSFKDKLRTIAKQKKNFSIYLNSWNE